jgi:hypothetical protein
MALSVGGSMRKRLVFLVICMALMLISPGRKLRASGYTAHYIVTCADVNRLNRCGCTYGDVLGEWDRACDGTLTGWGVLPFSDPTCTNTDSGEFTFCD